MGEDREIRARARKYGIPFIDLTREIPDRKCLELLHADYAREHNSLPIRFLDKGVLVAISDPDTKERMDALSQRMGKKVYVALAEKDAIQKAIALHYTSDVPRDDRAMTKKTESKREGRILSIISNKGGVGKTHIAANVARIMYNQGKGVLLIDADLGNADISNKLALFPDYTLYDFLLGDIDLDQMVEHTPYGFDLVAGSSGEFKLANINYVQRSKFIRQFRKISQQYDITIFDLSAGISAVVLDFAMASDESLIVTTPQDIIAGYACIKASFQRFKTIEERLLRDVEFYVPQKVYVPLVVMNQITSLNQGIFIFNRICQTINERINAFETTFSVKPEYLGGVLFDKDGFRNAEMQRKLITDLYPASKSSQCLEYLGRSISEPPEKRTSEQGFKSGFSRFATIFGIS
ncbi:MAG TPA: hypothetical protein ENN34_10370 [Deltaproteobacteria bacterium]|nr:hypothetical protein [Deltaproteobacteria bacterium]